MAAENESITSIDQFAAALEAADSPEQQDDENAQPAPETDPEAQSVDPDAPDGLDGDPDAPVGGEGDQPETESLDDKVVAWETASGEKFEVPVAEMKLGYMRDQDYRHKTQAFAQEREQTVQHIQQQYQVVETFAKDIGQLHAVNAQIAALEQAIPSIDRQGDPVGYMDVMTHLQQLRESRTGIAGRVQEAQQSQQQQQQQQLQQAQQRMVSELQTSIPGFNQELIGKMNATAQTYGYSPQELQTVADPRFVRLVHDAMQLKTLQAKAPGAVNKVKAAPIKPAKQGNAPVQTGVEQQVKAYSKNKSLANFAALYKSTL